MTSEKLQSHKAVISSSVLSFFFFALMLQADPMFTTFVSRDSPGSLQKQTIVLKIDKKDIPVTELLFVDTQQRAPDILFHAAGRRHYVLLYDLVFSKPEDLVLARKTTLLFLEKLGTDDLVALAGITKKAGLQFFCTFTTDRNKIFAGLNMMGKATAKDYVEGPEGYYYSAHFSEDSVSVPLITEDQFLNQLQSFLIPEKKKADNRPAFIQELVNLAFHLSTIEGRKNILLFSPGFDTEGIGRSRSGDITPPQLSVADEVVDIDSEREEETSGPEAPSFEVDQIPNYVTGSDSHFHVISQQKNEFYQTLVTKTGGVYSSEGEGVAGDIERILSTDNVYYVVGWEGNREKQFKNLHSLKIESAGKTISNQQRITPKPSSEYVPLEKKLNISEAIYRDYPSLPGYQFWADYFLEDTGARFSSFIQIPESEIMKKGASILNLDCYGFTIGKDGLVDDSSLILARLDLKNKKLKEKIAGSGLKVWHVLLGREEPTLVRLVIADWQTGEISTSTIPVKAQVSALTMTYPFFPSLNLNWIVWPPTDEASNRRGIQIVYPYRIGVDFFFPDLAPTMKNGEKDRFLYLSIYNQPQDAKNPPVRFRLVNENNNAIEIEQFGLAEKPTPLPHKGISLFWKILSLPQVPPGLYRFQVILLDVTARTKIEREIEVEIQ